MADDPKAREVLDEALAKWSAGDYYEAHETLEDLVDLVEDDDREVEIALALVHVAASLHKVVNDVGKGAVPSKLARALEVLRDAPKVWRGIDLAGLVRDLEAVQPALLRYAEGSARTVPSPLPVLRLAR